MIMLVCFEVLLSLIDKETDRQTGNDENVALLKADDYKREGGGGRHNGRYRDKLLYNKNIRRT